MWCCAGNQRPILALWSDTLRGNVDVAAKKGDAEDKTDQDAEESDEDQSGFVYRLFHGSYHRR